MSITKLHIFNKNTDAVASVRGYEYQKLKTLEAWLLNGISGNEEDIYCEYEEDIFHRNAKTQTSKFRQIKLYSSNFSFSNDEIQKALVHFFSLFSKSEYIFDTVEFTFEANSTISREQAGNNGKLLHDWNINQDNLSGDLLGKCVNICKEIITEYYTSEFKKAESTGKLTPEIKTGYSYLQELSNETWELFVKAITWKFDNTTPEVAIDRLVITICDLILKQPHQNFKTEEVNTVLAYLHFEVSKKTIETEPQNRVLNLALLQSRLLEQGSEMDNWYSKVLAEWRDVKDLKYFIIGDFYEVLAAAQYCRNHSKLYTNADIWKSLLTLFFNFPGISEYHRKKTIYEIVWLTIKPDYDKFKLKEDVIALDKELRFYFQTLENIDSKEEYEDMLNLLNIVFPYTMQGKTSFTLTEIMQLETDYSAKLDKDIASTVDLNLKCYLLENKGLHNISFHSAAKKMELEDATKPFFELINLLPKAPIYNITALSERLNKINDAFSSADQGKHEAIIDVIDIIIDELQPFALDREGSYKVAKQEIARGIRIIKSAKKDGLLKALTHFHKAKNHYLTDATMEGYVLAVLNISQLYNSIGLNYAAKYYALTGLWASVNDGKAKLLNRISQSFRSIFVCDFSQGAWMSGFASFSHFLNAKIEFDPSGFDEGDLKITTEIGAMLCLAQKIIPELNSQFDYTRKQWGPDINQEIEGVIKSFNEETKTIEKQWEILGNKLWDKPFNDLGKKRQICWEALGSNWTISFDNNSQTTGIAEEFCSILQILIGEIMFNNSDFHLLKNNIYIELSIGETYIAPEQIMNAGSLKYKLTLKSIGISSIKDISHHNSTIGSFLLLIFGELSLLKTEEIYELYIKLFSEQDLMLKTYTLNTYHRIYGEFFDDKLFQIDQRANYNLPVPSGVFPKTNTFLEWPSFLSSKYSQERSINLIKGRYKNSVKLTSKTINRLNGEPQFIHVIKKYRAQGWLDWQILLSMVNFMIDYKTKLKMEGKSFATDKEFFEENQRIMFEYLDLSEEDFYVQFPPEAFDSEGFESQFLLLPSIIIKKWGLECRSEMPNFSALREFLNYKFNFSKDEVIELSPFKDIA